MSFTPGRVLPGIAVLAFGAVAFALFSQHGLGMPPCAWCILQRLMCLAIGLVALAGWLARNSRRARALALGIVALLSAGGIAAAWYQHTVAAKSFTCDMTFADRVVTASGLDILAPQVFGIYATCADSAVALLGVQYELWTLMLFAILALISMTTLVAMRKP